MSVKVAIAQINSTVGDISGNRNKIVEFARRAAAQGADIVVTPELSLVGYPPEDLLLRQAFYAKTEEALQALTAELAGLKDVHVVVGHPVLKDGARFNAASVLLNGRITGSYHKLELPNDSVFDEKRYFTPDGTPLVFDVKGTKFGINICEDTWFPRAPAHAKGSRRASPAGPERFAVPHEQAVAAPRRDARQRHQARHAAGVRQSGWRPG
jgi:NAD+ synthase (glutamine-hydrolysing)